jgi:potassium/hydrogen antiporter
MASLPAWIIAGAGIIIIYGSRCLILKGLRQAAAAQLLWIAPRGLITVLLFLSAKDSGKLDAFPFGAVMLIVLATATLTALAHRQTTKPAPDVPIPEPAAVPEVAAVPPKS